jgi:hypothetical protein
MTIARRALSTLLVLVAVDAGAAIVTRGPYLQQPTPTSVIVRWRTDVAEPSRVTIGPAPGSLGQDFDDATPTTEHVVPVTGLSPDTQYFYAVGSPLGPLVGDDPNHFFRTSPIVGTPRPFRIWTIGDAGFVGANLNAVRDAFAAFNGGSATDLFLLLGDNAYVLGTDNDYQAALFNAHQAMLRTTPVYSIFGNHEAFSSNSVTQTGPYFTMFSMPTGGEAGGVASGSEAYYAFDWGNVHFVVLDSEQAPAAPGTPMLTWLEADLQAATADWIVVSWHRPPYSRGLLHDSDVEVAEVRMRQFVLPILDTYGVDVVLAGHSHNYERSPLLNGHYGLSSTYNPAIHAVDPGDGDPAGNGAYTKEELGPEPGSGAVYVVNGSGSEVRNTTLNHPAMIVGLLELGSVVVDVDGGTLTARMLNSAGVVRDTFRIVKGTGCPRHPVPGCVAGARGRISLADRADDARDSWQWQWDGPIAAGDLGDPTVDTEFAVCVWDAAGQLVGGSLPAAVLPWTVTPTMMLWNDASKSYHGLRRIRLRPGTGTTGRIRATARGLNVGSPDLPAAVPVRAQLLNLSDETCWESSFPAPRRNDGTKLVARLP